jgi:hypothetical protein
MRLAADMLLEMSALGMGKLAIDGGKARKGKPQSDVLARYLRNASQSEAVKAGFLAVLTDLLGSYAEGNAGHSLAAFYERQ